MAEPTYWNGEPCKARRVVVVVADASFPLYWARPFVGQQRNAVEISEANQAGPQPFYIDDEGYEQSEEAHRFLTERRAAAGMETSKSRAVGSPGWGWAKVTVGRGGPMYGHADLQVERVVRERDV